MNNTYFIVQVAPPGLHLTLGIFYRLWTLLEAECHQLDLELAQHMDTSLSQDSQSFAHYCELIAELTELTKKRNDLTMKLTNLTMSIGTFTLLSINDQAFDSLKEEILCARQQLEDTVCYDNNYYLYI